MDYLLPDKAYKVLKWVGLILCPALATFLGAIGPSFGLDVAPYVTTINALGVLIGACIGASQISAAGKSDYKWGDE